jgi:hypothetical protein
MGAFFSKFSKKNETKQIGNTPTEDFIKLNELTVKPPTNTKIKVKFSNGETKDCKTEYSGVSSKNPYDILAKCSDESVYQLKENYYDKDDTEIKIEEVESRIRGGKRRFSKKIGGKWSMKYKKSINCNRPKGFSQKQHCKYGRKSKKNIKK